MSLVWKPGFTQWDPASITTALWLDAADASTITTVSGAVSQWNDKSGNGRNATESTNRPTLTANALSGKNAVTFDGTNDQLIISSKFLSAYPVLIAAVVKENNGGFGGILTTHSDINDSSVALKINSARKFEYDPGAGIAVIASTSTGSSWGTVVGVSQANNDHLLTYNGATEVTSSAAATITGEANVTYLGKYRAFDADVNFAAFDLAELVVLTANVNAATRQRIEGYLAHKWGLTANLPNDHPYRWTPPTP